jgi:hypothetical protein
MTLVRKLAILLNEQLMSVKGPGNLTELFSLTLFKGWKETCSYRPSSFYFENRMFCRFQYTQTQAIF